MESGGGFGGIAGLADLALLADSAWRNVLEMVLSSPVHTYISIPKLPPLWMRGGILPAAAVAVARTLWTSSKNKRRIKTERKNRSRNSTLVRFQED
jgi:hypothetical protein